MLEIHEIFDCAYVEWILCFGPEHQISRIFDEKRTNENSLNVLLHL